MNNMMKRLLTVAALSTVMLALPLCANAQASGEPPPAACLSILAKPFDGGLDPRIEPDCDSIGFQTHKQIFCCCNQFQRGFGSSLACNGLDKGRSGESCLRRPREEDTKSRLLDPGADILKRYSAVSVLAHPFGARCFHLLCCQRKTSLPGWR